MPRASPGTFILHPSCFILASVTRGVAEFPFSLSAFPPSVFNLESAHAQSPASASVQHPYRQHHRLDPLELQAPLDGVRRLIVQQPVVPLLLAEISRPMKKITFGYSP